MAIDYFTKWIEAKPLVNITETTIENFFRDDIIYWFGIPKVVITDNGKQFDNSAFKRFYARYHINVRKTSIAHPQSNSQVEKANQTLLDGIKRRLDEAKGAWADELLSVLWSYKTTARTPMGETPFCLTYDTEALIPVDMVHPSFRATIFDEISNEEGLWENLEFIDEIRENALVLSVAYKQRVAQFFNRKVHRKNFQVGGLVLRKANISEPKNVGKLNQNLEGPYIVSRVVCPGTYHLQTQGVGLYLGYGM
ncbi:uncharacterized protein LOC122070280 [Macadamia integrifolia]|uniref:uncharacterized protein LOC122070280 n=1 Tax=Macadamia integrifolia TaxID=60698 RepID=UPI001C4F449B|nr:uncharacterized protein LOC122070280 [Macadamia integrifolia]